MCARRGKSHTQGYSRYIGSKDDDVMKHVLVTCPSTMVHQVGNSNAAIFPPMQIERTLHALTAARSSLDPAHSCHRFLAHLPRVQTFFTMPSVKVVSEEEELDAILEQSKGSNMLVRRFRTYRARIGSTGLASLSRASYVRVVLVVQEICSDSMTLSSVTYAYVCVAVARLSRLGVVSAEHLKFECRCALTSGRHGVDRVE